MTFKTLAVAACTAGVAFGAASSAFAQAAAPQAAAAAAPAAAAINHGPAIAGLCIFSVDGAADQSTVGRYVVGRLQQLAGQVNAELGAERTSLDNDAKALDAQRTTLDQNTLGQRAQALQARATSFQRKAALRERELQATQQKALGRISQEMDPLIRAAYQAQHCSVLISREAVMLGNPAMDLTPAVVTQLNAKLTQFPFEREHLEDQAAGGAPPVIQTPAPAARAPAAPARATRKK